MTRPPRREWPRSLQAEQKHVGRSLPGRLKLVQKVAGALCMGGGLKDRALVIAQDCQSILDVGRVLFARLRRELKARAQEGSAQFRDQLFGRVAFVAKALAAEVAIESRGMASPVHGFMSKG